MHSMANLTPHRLHLPDLAEHCFCQYQLALDGVAGRPMLARHFFRVCPKNDVSGYDFQLMHSEFLEAMKIQGCLTPEGHRRDARAYIRPLGSAHTLSQLAWGVKWIHRRRVGLSARARKYYGVPQCNCAGRVSFTFILWCLFQGISKSNSCWTHCLISWPKIWRI